jgi:hypothetical protein
MLVAEPIAVPRLHYASGFRKMFWGFLFIGVSFRISITIGNERVAVDLLPDFIGYLLIAVGADRLLALHSSARWIRNLALLLSFLAIPECVEYYPTIHRVDGLFYAFSPYFAWGALVSVLDIVLVWKLCGLIADVTKDAVVVHTADCARTRRVLYIGLRLLAWGAIGLFYLVTSRFLLLTLAVALVLSVVMLCLMMGLMRQAERLAAAGLVVDQPSVVQPASGITFRLLLLIAILLPVGLACASIYYYVTWDLARQELERRNPERDYDRIIDEFLEEVEHDQLDVAYERMTPTLRERLSREQFEDLVRQNHALRKIRQENQGAGAGAGSGSIASSYASRSYTAKNPDGSHMTVTIIVRRPPDSLLQRLPPLPGVDEFSVQQGTPHGLWLPFRR